MQTFQEYQAAFTAHLRQPQQQPRPRGVNPGRMAIYREIVFNQFLSSVSACFPVLQSILGKRRFSKLARQCFASHHFASPLFRDIPKAFTDFLSGLDLATDSLPPFAGQLAHYEWIELYVSHLVAEAPPAPEAVIHQADDLADAIVQLQPAHQLLSYDYPVHQLSRKQAHLPAMPTYLLVFRTADFKIQFVQLNDMTYQLLQGIQSQALPVSHHLAHVADNLLPHLSRPAITAYGLQAFHTLYLQQAIVVRKPGAV